MHVKAQSLVPRGAPRRVWQAAYDNKEVLMVNSLNNVVKYFKNYDFKEAEKEVTAHKELNKHSNNGLSDRAKQIKRTDRAKTTDELRKIQMDNNFLRTNAKEYRLHPRFNLLFGVDKGLFGTMNDAALREWRLNAEKDKQPVNILNIKKNYNLEEWSLAHQLFIAGSRANPDLVKFLYSLKGHHDKQYRKNAREIAFVAAYAAATRNELRHVTETTKLEIESIKTNLEVIRHAQGMDSIYNIDASKITDEKVKAIEKQVDARNNMVYDRDGEFPLVDTGKQIIEGIGEIRITDKMLNNDFSNKYFIQKGNHFRKTDGGYSEEDLEERDISTSSFLDTKNCAYTEEENRLIALENGEPRAKLRKECDKLNHSGEELGRAAVSISDASIKIESDNIMDTSDSQNSICDIEMAVVKKPGTKRIQDRAKKIMQNINTKITQELAGSKNYPMKHINIGDNELALVQFNKEDFEEISNRPYISLTGEVLISLTKHQWPKKGKKPDESMLHQRISLQEMQRTWFSIALLYSRGVRAILGAILEINLKRTTARLNHNMIMECADLKNDLEIFESGLSDSNWAEMFATREDKGRTFCPLPTLILYNTIMNYLPIIKSKFGEEKLRFKKYPNDEQIAKQIDNIHQSRLDHSPQGKFITKKDPSGSDRREGNNRRRWRKLNDASNTSLNLSEMEINRSEYNLFLDGAYDYDAYNEWIENNVIPIHRQIIEDNPEFNYLFQNLSTQNPNQSQKSEPTADFWPPCSTPIYKRPFKERFNYDASNIYVPEKERRKSDTVKVSTNSSLELRAKEIFERPLGIPIDPTKLILSEPIKEEYLPKFVNEKIKFQFGNCIRRNPLMPSDSEIEIQFKNHKIKTKISDAPKSIPKFYNLTLSYANINPPIQLKLKKLVESDKHSRSAFVCVSEVRTKMDLIIGLDVIPLGYRVFTHKPVRSGLCFAFILVKIDLPGSIEVIYDAPPIIILRWKNKGRSLLIGGVYRPHAKSNIYFEDFSKEDFAERLFEITKLCDKPPAVICSDLNIDLKKVVLTEDKKVRRMIDLAFCRFDYIKTDETFFRNDKADGTTIDYIFFRKVVFKSHELEYGRETIGTDGHMVFRVEFDITLNGIIGTTIVKSRPPLDPVVVSKLANSLYPGLKAKLDAAEIIMYDKYKVPEGEKFSNKELQSFDDNDYCEIAFNFFEEFFSILQPETERKVNIYNYATKTSQELTDLNTLYTSLNNDLRSEKDKLCCINIRKSIAEIEEMIEQVKIRDRKQNLTGKRNVNDDDFYAIVKALRPKMRNVQMTKEIFTADQLAEEYNRVYSGITKHISESEVTLDILQLCPKINEALKFSFDDWLPTWSRTEACVKTISHCFNSLKAKTRGLNSSLYRDGMAMLPVEFIEIIDKMILYWTKGGNYPKKFLSGKLKSILKKGDASLIKNRRFISVGNFFQQLLGKVTAACVLAYCEFNKLLDDDQYGFRQFRSTDLAVASLRYKVASKNDMCTTILLFIDFSSAFFCVKKDLLLDILSTFINKEAMIFFTNLLQPITATVVSDGVESEEIKVPDFGVRQGGGDSPLHFNLCQNMIFKYVSEPMQTRYDKKYLNLQGFADDSILIASEVGNEKVMHQMERGLKKVVSYVTSVGFCINPSKSEAMIVCKNNERGLYKKELQTSQGCIKIKHDEVNILGNRIDEFLTFKPQYKHVMAKVVRMKYDILDVLKLGTCRQVLKAAFSKCNGVYTYGIGIQPVWTKKQYRDAQKEVNDLIRLVYEIKWMNEDSWRQNDMLRMVNWPPIRLQHAKAALFTLNKVALNPRLEFLYDKVNHHLRLPDGSSFLENRSRIQNYEDDPIDASNIPVIGLSVADKKNMSCRVKKAFPLTVNHWFKDLPDFIKILIGTHEFFQAVEIFYKRACWHREEADCSLCKYNRPLFEGEYDDFESMVNHFLEEEQISKCEFDTTFDASYFENYTDTFLDEDDIQFAGYSI